MNCFTKSQRLLSKREFDTTLNEAEHKIVCRDFVLVVSPSVGNSSPRIGLIVSGKVGNSVIRNRIKRSIREVFRKDWSQLDRLSGRDIVVIARPALVDLKADEILTVQDSLRKCGARLLRKISMS